MTTLIAERGLTYAVAAFLHARGLEPNMDLDGLVIGRGEMGVEAAVTLEAGRDFTDLESILERVAAARDAGAAHEIPVIGLSGRGAGHAKAALADANARAMTPLGFFDRDFLGDRRLRDAVNRHAPSVRGPQPYRRLTGLQPGHARRTPVERGLFSRLYESLIADPTGPSLTLISGPAGVGKTVLIAELVGALQTHFNRTKQAYDGLAARPLLFEPTELGAREPPESVSALFEQLQSRSLAAKDRMPAAAFDWMNEAGLSIWVFDGLDEFYRQQTDFFQVLDAKLDDPDSRARIVICTRDSLLAAGRDLVAFLERRFETNAEQLALYELARWSEDDKRGFFEASLTAQGRTDADLEKGVRAIMRRLEKNESLAKLTDLPFYAAAFFGSAERLPENASEFDLLDSAVDKLIMREDAKLIFDWSIFAEVEDRDAGAATTRFRGSPQMRGLRALKHSLGGVAHFFRFGEYAAVAGAEMPADDLRAVFEFELSALEDDPALKARYLLMMEQFPFFGRGSEPGLMDFVHDTLADYLAGRYAAAELARAPDEPALWRKLVGARRPIEQSFFFRVLVDEMQASTPLREGALKALDYRFMREEHRKNILALLARS